MRNGKRTSESGLKATSNRRKQLDEIFKNVGDDQKQLIDKMLDELVFLEEEMEKLQKLPFIKVNPNNPEQQKVTPAAKLYKEHSQSFMNAVRILSRILEKTEASSKDQLMEMLSEFE